MKRKLFVAAGVAIICVLMSTAVASANHGRRQHTGWKQWNSSNATTVSAWSSPNFSQGTEYWNDFRLIEAAGFNAWDGACHTQGYINGNTPGAGTLYSGYSDYDSGCYTIRRWIAPSGWNATYPADIYFGMWWRSDASGGRWTEIAVFRR